MHVQIWFILIISYMPERFTRELDNTLIGNNLVFVIAGQGNKYHAKMAEDNKRSIEVQALRLNRGFPTIHLSHKDFPDSYVPPTKLILSAGSAYADSDNIWIIFLEENTEVNLQRLYEMLAGYNASQELWIGHGFRTRETSFINPPCSSMMDLFRHHLMYSSGETGFAITIKLLKRLSIKIESDILTDCFWTICMAYRYRELAFFMWYRANRRQLIEEPAFCTRNSSSNCAAYPRPFQPCGPPIPVEHIYFAVNTCLKFHATRIPVLKRTWAKHATNVQYFSDFEDDTVPTVGLRVFHEHFGFCKKHQAMLVSIQQDIDNFPDVKWIALLDDDTILSVLRLRELLSCYDHTDAVAIGEVHLLHTTYYLNGGAGRIVSRPVLENYDPKICRCHYRDFPEDWNMGHCFMDTNITMVHSSMFHMLPPMFYSSDLLEHPVSFHGKSPDEMLMTYLEWFALYDSNSQYQ